MLISRIFNLMPKGSCGHGSGAKVGGPVVGRGSGVPETVPAGLGDTQGSCGAVRDLVPNGEASPGPADREGEVDRGTGGGGAVRARPARAVCGGPARRPDFRAPAQDLPRGGAS